MIFRGDMCSPPAGLSLNFLDGTKMVEFKDIPLLVFYIRNKEEESQESLFADTRSRTQEIRVRIYSLTTILYAGFGC